MIKTQQQIDIINAAKQGSNLVIKAFAGCGKTSTLKMVSEELNKPSLYIAFNKSIATEASEKFPQHVICQTINSIAWRAIVKSTKSAYARKLQGSFNYDDIDDNHNAYDQLLYKLEVINIVTGFCHSAYPDIASYITGDDITTTDPSVVKAACKLWNDASDDRSSVKMTHDVYLKLFQLRKETLPYNIIYLDEAQDSNPVTLSIFYNQKHAQLIMVGDSYQAIYEWRGAVNALDSIPEGFIRLYLSESFRFTSEIADIATKLTYVSGNDIPVIGKAEPVADTSTGTTAILVRTNAFLMEILMTAVNTQEKVYVLADLDDLWKRVYYIASVKYDKKPRYSHKELSQYTTAEEVYAAAKELPELAKLLSVVGILEVGGLTTNINKIKEIIVDNPEDAHFTLSTIHKSKGLEWDNVVISSDIALLKDNQTIADVIYTDQLLNLMYVAATRAKYKVTLPFIITSVIEQHKQCRENNPSLEN